MSTDKQIETKRQDWENVRKSLRSLRDEIRVRAHLATMDLKDEWTKLEPKLNEAENYAEVVSDSALAAAKELQRRAQQLGEKLAKLKGQHSLRG